MKITHLPFHSRMFCLLILGQALSAGLAPGQVLVSPTGLPDGKSGSSGEGGRTTMDSINEGLNSNEGGTIIGITKDTLDHGLNTAAGGHHQAAWQGSKMGASSQTIGDHLGSKGDLKNASGKLGTGAVLIDHVGYTSTAAGEVAGGRWGQAVITVIDGVGKWASTGVGATIGGALGSAGGPAGTIVGGAAGGYTGSTFWDKTGGKLTTVIKDNLSKQEDKKTYGEMFGPKIPAGKTPEQIHQEYKEFMDKRNKQKQQGDNPEANKAGDPVKVGKAKTGLGGTGRDVDIVFAPPKVPKKIKPKDTTRKDKPKPEKNTDKKEPDVKTDMYDGTYSGKAGENPLTVKIQGGKVSFTIGKDTGTGSVSADGTVSAVWKGIINTMQVSYGDKSETIDIKAVANLSGKVRGDNASGSLSITVVAPGAPPEVDTCSWSCARGKRMVNKTQ